LSQPEPEAPEDPLAEFASRAIRRPAPGAYELLLSQHLVAAVGADPITKIRLICEAALMVPQVREEEKDTAEILYAVATSLDQTRINVTLDARADLQPDWRGMIAWSFPPTKENFEKYIAPWLGETMEGLYYKYRGRDISEEADKAERAGPHEYFFWLTDHAHNSALERLRSRFAIWATPRAMKIATKLIEKIEPDTYKEILSRVKT